MSKFKCTPDKAFFIVCSLLSILLLLQNDHYLTRYIISLEKAVEAQHQPPYQDGPRVKFIAYPHRISLGSGSSVQCRWETIDHDNGTKLATLIGGNAQQLDYTQRTALSEGICISPTLEQHLHIFSSTEAIECLSSSSSSQLIITGDSYMKQLFIGLADILLSKHVSKDKEILNSAQRNKILTMSQHLIEGRRLQDSSFPSVTFGCQPEECYGKRNMTICSACINNISNQLLNNVTWVLGVGIHSVSRYYQYTKRNGPAINSTIHEITTFLDTQRQDHQRDLIFVSSPSYHYNADYPTQHERMTEFYEQLLPQMIHRSPFVDVFQATDSCIWKNCSVDGSHRKRFVNRWKAQLLLNTLCEVV
ncbi:hypothetical protein ACHAWO_001407 [Cyclotella atomus]|uniref:Uncharacterized protein n=1 Tax=Cyclotella atomus TaxID=382360 RepID=A0ABD3QDW9_9STRA